MGLIGYYPIQPPGSSPIEKYPGQVEGVEPKLPPYFKRELPDKTTLRHDLMLGLEGIAEDLSRFWLYRYPLASNCWYAVERS